MRYISTRGNSSALTFDQVATAGLAEDGGLYVPEAYPHFDQAKIASFKGMPYTDLMFEVIAPFVGGAIPDADIKRLIAKSYEQFDDPKIAPLVPLETNEYVLELFHGPTMAFKDFALQFLGSLLDYLLSKNDQSVTIVGATSGDTGSAAIEGCRHSDRVQMFIMHPEGRISDVQRKQMTTILADNVHNIALQGSFDDCQDLTKALFNDQSFLQGKSRLTAVNSINWCRILAQIVYYFYAAAELGAPEQEVSFSVPTGNFGDIFAGYVAKKMGLPIKQLVIATNKNDILHRFFHANDYSRGELVKTLSPSMDIQIASNFERFLFDLHDRDGATVNDMMHRFRQDGLSVSGERLELAQSLFDSYSVDDETTASTMKHIFQKHDYHLDPHTAIGVEAARQCNRDESVPMVVLATAHPAKFPAADADAGLDYAALPSRFANLFERQEQSTSLANDTKVVQEFILNYV